MATVNGSDGNADDDVTDADDGGGGAVAAADGPADTYAAASDAASSTDCRRYDESAVDDKNNYDDEDCDEGVDDDSEDDGIIVVDEDVNVVAAVVSVGIVAEDGREPLPLLIQAPPLHDLLVPLFLPKQVRGPVREVEEGEYDWEEDPRNDVDALGPRWELGKPRPAAVFFPWLHMYFAMLQFIHRHGLLRVSD